ncbi:MAG TPA: hypothetical protein VM695_06635 [Phycisphaerae bacterium]|nr:hypothetical protein [Phycisphaerae bacterium]
MTRREYYDSFEPKRLTRAWWLVRLRGVAWVAVVTALVWIYADAEFTDEMTLNAAIELAPALPDRFVLQSKAMTRVSFTARGRRSSLEQVERWLRQAGTVLHHPVTEGERSVDVRDVLNRSKGVWQEGVTVLSASPAVLRVQLDRRIPVPDLPVRLEYTGAFPTETTVTPSSVGIQVAEGDWEKIRKAEAEPVLRTVSVDLRNVQDDTPFEVTLVRQIAGVPVEPDRPSVTVRVKIAQLTETEELTVPVQVISPTAWMEDGTWGRYALKRQNPLEWRAKVQVSGTRKDLDQLKVGDVQAYVMLTDDDKKPVSWLTRQVEVRLPRGLDLKLLGPRPTVTFKLEKLPAAGPT